MNFIQIIFMLAITLVVLEFGIHVIYHALTGKAGIDDPAFDYLKDIGDLVSAGQKNSHAKIELLHREESYAHSI